ncbi:hypothetical protein [Symbiobacterium terraclitae]|uniref:hypothetical protein n=1 Tax=Symbiobacterium terraclitae TaxID=557451 RepID=UPI0035B55360
MGIVSDAQRRQIRELFDSHLRDPVEVLFFYVDPHDPHTAAMREILDALVGASGGRIRVRARGGREGQAEAAGYRVEQAPALVLLDGEGGDTRVRFYGATVGYEFMVFLEDLIDVSRGGTRLSEAARRAVRAVDQDLVIQVFTTPT